MKWIPFDQSLGSNQPLPQLKRMVLVASAARESENIGLPPSVSVGYLKFAAGDINCPFFVCPGVGGTRTHWCDCLGDDFKAPCWKMEQPQ